MNFKWFVSLMIILLPLCFHWFKNSHFDKRKLDAHYLSEFRNIKSRLMNGSSVESKKDLEDYEDRIILYMHLDGYNGVEILDMRCKALLEAYREEKNRKHTRNKEFFEEQIKMDV